MSNRIEPIVDEEAMALAVAEEMALVGADDWDLGPACGLDPEVCESCQ